MRVAAILTAAGDGRRLGHALPKALVSVGGVPLVVHAARALAGSGAVDEIVVTVPASHQADFAAALTGAVEPASVPVRLVVGGPTRQASVLAALGVLGADVDAVLVHDAARAFAPPALVVRVLEALRAGDRAVVPVVPVTDTVVRVQDGVVHPIDRSLLRVVQTPQGFDRALLDQAHAAAADRSSDEASAATDDASLCAAIGARIAVVEGSDDARKVTTAHDLAVAEALATGAAGRLAPSGTTTAGSR